MLERCYSARYQERKPTYKGCSVCDEWLNYQNFAKWYDDNYYEIKGEIMCLDKDILVKGNKIYSPENCVFVPNYINVLFARIGCKNKESKEQLIKDIANTYKKDIPSKLYEAMCKYKVEIND